MYNITNNCSLTIYPNNEKIFNSTYELIYMQYKINYTINLLLPVTSPTITYNNTKSLITCKKTMGQILIYF